jgi:tetratricopeptide (TPR) repeat protein
VEATKKVFVSSTGRDLHAYRDAVYQANAKVAGFSCIRMEDFGAIDQAPLSVCLERVRECDVFLGITGHCYGSCPPDDTISFTEHEYDAAVSANKPRLMFIAPEDFAFPFNLREPEELFRRQQQFRQRILGERVVAAFDNPDHLATQAATALANWRSSEGMQPQSSQIIGDGNLVVVSAGSAHLQLDRKHRRMKPAQRLQDILQPEGAIALVGRANEIAGLQTWLESDRPVSVHCIFGRAGTGKTRIAVELCALAEGLGWLAGFAPRRAFQEFAGGSDAWKWTWTTPLLVVVDAAAGLTENLRDWLEILAKKERPQYQPRLRILLLERDARREFGWWWELLRPRDRDQPRLEDLVYPEAPFRLPSLTKVEDRRALLEEVLEVAARIAGSGKKVVLPAPRRDPTLDWWLSSDAIEVEPLVLIMFAIVSLETGASAFNLSRAGIAAVMVGHEEERLRRLGVSWGLKPDFVLHVIACVTLEGGCDLEGALRLVEEERAKMFEADSPYTVVHHLAQALPPQSFRGIDAIRPDIIGELFAVSIIGRSEFPDRIVERSWRRETVKVGITLIHVAEDYPDSETEDLPESAGRVGIRWLDQLITLETDIYKLRAIETEIAFGKKDIYEIAAALNNRIVNLAQTRLKEAPELQTVIADAYGRIAARLFSLGRLGEALEPAERAIELYRKLDGARSLADEYAFGDALNVYANALKSLDRSKEAHEAAAECVHRLRPLLREVSPATLAGVLGTLGATLMDLEKFPEALEIDDEAIGLMQSSGILSPNDIKNLSIIHLNRAHTLFSLGRSEEALAAGDQALEIRYQEIRQDDPSEGRVLARYIGLLSRLVLEGSAVEAADHALYWYRKLGHSPEYKIVLRKFVELSWKNLREEGKYRPAASIGEKIFNLYEELGLF